MKIGKMNNRCSYTKTIYENSISDLPKHMRCPECGKRMKPKISTCTDNNVTYCCVFATLPADHRKPAGGKKFVRKEKKGRKE